MKRAVNKLRSRLGETFVEVLVALLIVGLATMLLASMVTASGSIDANTREQDVGFYKAVSDLESGSATPTTTSQVTVDWGGATVNVDNVTIYEQDGLKAWKVTP